MRCVKAALWASPHSCTGVVPAGMASDSRMRLMFQLTRSHPISDADDRGGQAEGLEREIVKLES